MTDLPPHDSVTLWSNGSGIRWSNENDAYSTERVEFEVTRLDVPDRLSLVEIAVEGVTVNLSLQTASWIADRIHTAKTLEAEANAAHEIDEAEPPRR